MANDDKSKKRIAEAIDILGQFGLPRAQINERTAYCLLALLNVTPDRTWRDSESPLVGITPMTVRCQMLFCGFLTRNGLCLSSLSLRTAQLIPSVALNLLNCLPQPRATRFTFRRFRTSEPSPASRLMSHGRPKLGLPTIQRTWSTLTATSFLAHTNNTAQVCSVFADCSTLLTLRFTLL